LYHSLHQHHRTQSVVIVAAANNVTEPPPTNNTAPEWRSFTQTLQVSADSLTKCNDQQGVIAGNLMSASMIKQGFVLPSSAKYTGGCNYQSDSLPSPTATYTITVVFQPVSDCRTSFPGVCDLTADPGLQRLTKTGFASLPTMLGCATAAIVLPLSTFTTDGYWWCYSRLGHQSYGHVRLWRAVRYVVR